MFLLFFPFFFKNFFWGPVGGGSAPHLPCGKSPEKIFCLWHLYRKNIFFTCGICTEKKCVFGGVPWAHGLGLSVRRGFGGHHISYFIFQNHISKKKKKKTRVYGQKPIPSFRPRTLAGHLSSYVDMSGKFSGKCRAYTHQNGSGHIHGGDRYLKNGIESRVQNLSIAARYDQKFASGVPLPVGKSQKPKLKSGSSGLRSSPKNEKVRMDFQHVQF